MFNRKEGFESRSIIVPGYHAPQPEADFAQQIIQTKILPYYSGSIVLIGSRAAKEGPWWISKKRFIDLSNQFGLRLSPKDLERWIMLFNNLARERQLVRNKIITLEKEVDSIEPSFKIESSRLNDLRSVTRGFLSGRIVVPGSDIDFMLMDKTSLLPPLIYHDSETSQVIDILLKGEKRHIF